MTEELNKEEYIARANYLIEQYGRLDMIYLRVSTKDKGQQEEDQLPEILETFEIKEEECLIVRATESAYQENKQKNRVFNIFYDLIEDFSDINKRLFLWDLDRIYRNQKRQAYFICHFADKFNCKVLSFRQKFLHQFKNLESGFGDAMYNFMIEMFGWMAEEESRKKGDRLKKSLTRINERTYSNKGNLYGKKLKTTKGTNITDPKVLDQIDKAISKRIKEGVGYRTIQDLLKKKGIKISLGQLTNIKKKSL